VTITDIQLAQATGCKLIAADAWLPWINETLTVFDIDTKERIAAFLPQMSHESGAFRYTREIWGPTSQQKRYERNFTEPWPPSPELAKHPQYVANKLAYTLGNSEPGDGARFKGHGLLQITGRTNHAACRDGLRARGLDCPDFETDPVKLEVPRWAAMSAGWFWTDYKRLNELADAGEFERITKRINGGLNGQAERVALWESAKGVLA
jgi:putative chitinase